MEKEIFKVSYKERSYEVEADSGTSLETVWNSQKCWFSSDNVEVTISDSKGNSQTFNNCRTLNKKPYYFCMDVCSKRTGACIGKKTGVVYAAGEDEAKFIAWCKFRSDSSCNLYVAEVPDSGYSFTVYKWK